MAPKASPLLFDITTVFALCFMARMCDIMLERCVDLDFHKHPTLREVYDRIKATKGTITDTLDRRY